MDSPSSSAALRYFYIAYRAGEVTGNIILPQTVDPTCLIDHGMNIAVASRYIGNIFGTIAVIIFYEETTEKRFIDWNEYAASFQGGPGGLAYYGMATPSEKAPSEPAGPPADVVCFRHRGQICKCPGIHHAGASTEKPEDR